MKFIFCAPKNLYKKLRFLVILHPALFFARKVLILPFVDVYKRQVQVNEAAGFVVNRILIPMINEAAFIKMEGVSDIAGIDTAMKLGACLLYTSRCV